MLKGDCSNSGSASGSGGWDVTTEADPRTLFVARVLVERRLHDRGADPLATNVDLELRPFLRAGQREIGSADRLAQGWTHRATAHLTGLLSLVEHGMPVSRDGSAVVHREADETTREPLLLLLQQRVASHEVALVQLREPAKVGFERRHGVV